MIDVKAIINNVNPGMTYDKFKAVVDELCANGISKGCYQDYTDLMAVLTKL